MDKDNNDKVALFTGVSILVIALLAGFTAGYIPAKFMFYGDPNEVVQNFDSMMGLFRMNVLGWFLIILFDLVVSWGVYVVFRHVNHNLALFSGWLRLFYTMFLALSLSYLIKITTVGTVTSSDLINIDMFDSVWSIGLIVFGFHLLLLGVVMFKANFIHKIFSVLMLIAAVGYLLIQTLNSFFPSLAQVQTILEYILLVPMTVGELAFGVYLIIKRKSFLKPA